MREITMLKRSNNLVLGDLHWDFAFVGTAVDDRGRIAGDAVASRSGRTVLFVFDPATQSFIVDGEAISDDVIYERFRSLPGRRVVIEATTLGFTEIFFIFKMLKDFRVKEYDALYLEPLTYRNRTVSDRVDGFSKREFEISGETKNFRGVVGATRSIDQVETTVFLLGFEGHRLSQALEQLEVEKKGAFVLCGVPAFHAGWEMNTFERNINEMENHNISNDPLFCGADSPFGAYRELEKLAQLRKGGVIQIFPIGTKPHGIGAALFACDYADRVSLTYDFPVHKTGRTSEVSNWHLFKIGHAK